MVYTVVTFFWTEENMTSKLGKYDRNKIHQRLTKDAMIGGAIDLVPKVEGSVQEKQDKVYSLIMETDKAMKNGFAPTYRRNDCGK